MSDQLCPLEVALETALTYSAPFVDEPPEIDWQATSSQQQPDSEQVTSPTGDAVEQEVTGNAPEQRSTDAAQECLVAEVITEPFPTHAGTPMRTPVSLMQQLSGLPQWQALYVLRLREMGGILSLACNAVNVSLQSVQEAMADSPQFTAAVQEARSYRSDLVEAATYKAATIGDQVPVYQRGMLVGLKRVRSDKAAEIMLTLDGRLGDTAQQGKAPVRTVTLEAAAEMAAATMAKLIEMTRQRLPESQG